MAPSHSSSFQSNSTHKRKGKKTGAKRNKNPLSSDANALRRAKSKHKTSSDAALNTRRSSAEILQAQSRSDRLAHITQILAANFNRAQRSVASDRKCFAALKKLQMESDKDEFLECFLTLLFPILLCFKREASVERLIRFVAAFCTHSSLEQLIRKQQQQKRNQSGNEGKSVGVNGGDGEVEGDENDDGEDHIDESTAEFAMSVVERLIPLADVKEKSVRFRVCQIVGLVINNLPDSADIDESLYQSLHETFVRRLRDKVPIVRQMAIVALYRLQDPSDPSQEITSEFMRIMSTDANKDVRKEAINMLTLTKSTLPKFMERTRDVRDDVRAAAYSKIANVAALRRLTISQRVSLLKNGLKDRAKEVREICLWMLINQWMPQVSNNMIDLLKCFDVENYTPTSEMVIVILLERAFAVATTADDEVIEAVTSAQLKKVLEVDLDLLQLSPEAALYWRCRCDFLSKHDPVLLDQQLPTASEFCELIIHYHKEDCEFTTKQLLMIARHLDYADEVGRQKMHALLANMLVTFTHPETFTSEIIAAIKIIVAGNAHDFISTLVEKVDELRKAATVCQREGADDSQEVLEQRKEEVLKMIKSLKRKVKTLKRQERQFAEDEDYEGAGKTKKERRICELEIAELEEEYTQLERTSVDGASAEVMLWVRALCIIGEFLNQSPANVDITHLLYLVQDLVLVTLDHESDYVRQHSYKVLGQFCCFKIDLAKQYAGYFLRCLADEDQDLEVQATALRAVFDFIQLHGLVQLFEEASAVDDTMQQESEGDVLVTALKSFFTNEHSELRTIVVEGFAKLILCNKLHEKHLPDVLSRLVVMQFDPLTEKDERIRQCLPVFLPSYAFTFQRNMDIVSRIVVPTLRRVANSGPTHSNVDIAQLGQYLMYLSDPENLHQSQKDIVDIQDLLIHERVAISLALEILADPTSKSSNSFCRLFSNMTIFSVNRDQIKLLKYLVGKVIGEIGNKVTMRMLDKFDTMLVTLLDGEDMYLTEEQSAAVELKMEEFNSRRDHFIQSMLEDELNFDIASPDVVINVMDDKRENQGEDQNQEGQDEVIEEQADEQSAAKDLFSSPKPSSRKLGTKTPESRRSTRSLAQEEEAEAEAVGELGESEDDEDDYIEPPRFDIDEEEDRFDSIHADTIGLMPHTSSSDESDELVEQGSNVDMQRMKRRKKAGRRASDSLNSESKKVRRSTPIAVLPLQPVGDQGDIDDDDDDDGDLEGDIDALEGLLDDDDDNDNDDESHRLGQPRQRRRTERYSVLVREIEDIVDELDFTEEEDEDGDE